MASDYEAKRMGERVVVIHDTPAQTFISELSVTDACVLLDQLERAVGGLCRAVPGKGVTPRRRGFWRRL